MLIVTELTLLNLWTKEIIFHTIDLKAIIHGIAPKHLSDLIVMNADVNGIDSRALNSMDMHLLTFCK